MTATTRLQRLARAGFLCLGILALLTAVVFWRLVEGGLPLGFLGARLEALLESGLGGAQVEIGDAGLTWQQGGQDRDGGTLLLHLREARLLDDNGQPLAEFPDIRLGLDPWSFPNALLERRISISRIILVGGFLEASRAEDGGLALASSLLDATPPLLAPMPDSADSQDTFLAALPMLADAMFAQLTQTSALFAETQDLEVHDAGFRLRDFDGADLLNVGDLDLQLRRAETALEWGFTAAIAAEGDAPDWSFVARGQQLRKDGSGEIRLLVEDAYPPRLAALAGKLAPQTGDILAAAQALAAAHALAAPLSLRAHLRFGAGGTFQGAEVESRVAAGTLHTERLLASAPPLPLDTADFRAEYLAAAQRWELHEARFFSGDTRLQLAGDIDFSAQPNIRLRAWDSAVHLEGMTESPVPVEEFTLHAEHHPTDSAWQIHEALLFSDANRLQLSGRIDFSDPARPSASLRAWDSEIHLEGITESPIFTNEITLDADLALPAADQPTELRISDMRLAFGDRFVSIAGDFRAAPGSPDIRVSIASPALTGDQVLMLWPLPLESFSRRWTKDSVLAADLRDINIRLNLPPGALAAVMSGEQPLPPDSVLMEADLHRVDLDYVDILPPLLDATGGLRMRDNEFRAWADTARLRPDNAAGDLSLVGLEFLVPDTSIPDPPAHIRLDWSGAIGDVLAFLQDDGFDLGTGGLGMDAAASRGALAGDIRLNMPLYDDIAPEHLDLSVTAAGSDLFLPLPDSDIALAAADLRFTADLNEMRAEGRADILEVPTELRFRQSVSGPDSGAFSAALSAAPTDADLHRLAVSLPVEVSGPLALSLRLEGHEDGVRGGTLEVDATAAALTGDAFQWHKPAEQLATAMMTFENRGGGVGAENGGGGRGQGGDFASGEVSNGSGGEGESPGMGNENGGGEVGGEDSNGGGRGQAGEQGGSEGGASSLRGGGRGQGGNEGGEASGEDSLGGGGRGQGGNEGGINITDFHFQSQNAEARGRFSLSDKGDLLTADFPLLRVDASALRGGGRGEGGNEREAAESEDFASSEEENGGHLLSLTARRLTDNTLALAINGPQLDARALINNLLGGSGDDTETTDPEPDDSILLAEGNIQRVLAHNNVVLHNMFFSMRQEGDAIADMNLHGNFNPAPFALRLASPPDTTNRNLRITSADGGATLRGLDLYPHILGGDFLLEAEVAPSHEPMQMNGRVTGTAFRIADAPGFARLLSLASLTGIADLLTQNGISFQRLELPFAMTAEEIRLQDGVMSGLSLGLTLRGRIDPNAEQVELNGTLVPSYILNSLLGNVPLLGDLIVGREGEGIFGVTFLISGPVEDTDITANPLSVLTPGIFRRLTELGETPPGETPPGETDDADATTPATEASERP